MRSPRWLRVMIPSLLAAAALGCGDDEQPQQASGLTLDVGTWFPAGTEVLDRYSGRTAKVGGDGKVAIEPDAEGVVLLERKGATPTPFTWKSSTVYFVMTDRFFDGDPSNDHAFDRQGDGAAEIGTWHGGDWAGLAQKLDHIESLGATAIWISPIVEQVHGWVSGGSGDFKHYGYHGYWAVDFTRPDPNLGTEEELKALVAAAHARGIRVIADVVVNHPGYATGQDLLDCLPSVFNDGTGEAFRAQFGGASPPSGKTWTSWNDLVNYGTNQWLGWWGAGWIRAGLGGYQQGGNTEETKSVAYLPDFKTEDTRAVTVPDMFTTGCRSATTGVTSLGEAATVRDYLVRWQSDWVRRVGFDGFRGDTAKNVEVGTWAALHDAASEALAAWKAENPGTKIDDAPFWMTGEVWDHGVQKDGYFTQGKFDSLINFEYQKVVRDMLLAKPALVDSVDRLDSVWSRYAEALSSDPTFDSLSYLSSHDTSLFFGEHAKNDPAVQRQAATALMLVPGGAQIFYGDETGRPLGPKASDPMQRTRSGMNWDSFDASILEHFRKLGAFRKDHAAVGAGAQTRIDAPSGTYAVARTLSGDVEDAVVLVITRPR